MIGRLAAFNLIQLVLWSKIHSIKYIIEAGMALNLYIPLRGGDHRKEAVLMKIEESRAKGVIGRPLFSLAFFKSHPLHSLFASL
jgi:hypothetical protein